MLALRKKLTPQQEAQRQIEIAQEHERLAVAERERVAALTAENARRRQQMWAEKERAREERRLAAYQAQEQAKRDRRDQMREAQALIDQQKMEAYTTAKGRVDELDQQIAQLRNRSDLTSSEAGQLVGLRELRQQADARLLQAEQSIGRHRAGRA